MLGLVVLAIMSLPVSIPKPIPRLSPPTPPEMFHLENPHNLTYSESEALRAYYDSVSAVEQQYHLLDTPTPYFTLRLGEDKVPGVRFPASKTWTGAEICLPKWDVAYFREGVIALAINELLRPENIARLEKHIEDVRNATVGVEELKH